MLDEQANDECTECKLQGFRSQALVNACAKALSATQITDPSKISVHKFGYLDPAVFAVANGAAPHLSDLAAQTIPRLPRMPRCSQDLRAITRRPSSSVLRLSVGVDCPWLAWDSETHRNALLIDIDHDDALDRWLALPAAVRPHLVLDPHSGRAHAICPLATPVLVKENGRVGPQILADLAGRLLAAALGGTLLPTGSLVKNPWGLTRHLIGVKRRHRTSPVYAEKEGRLAETGLMWWTLTGPGPLELRNIIAALKDSYWYETAPPPARFLQRRKNRGEPDARGRNCTLFDLVRWWAYDHREFDGGRIRDEAERLNSQFPDPLPTAEVESTAKSIAGFMNSRYRPRAMPNKGRDQHLTQGLTPTEAQSVAAQQTNKTRIAASDDRVRTAFKTLRAEGAKLTQAAVASRAGVSLATVKRRWAILAPAPENGSEAALAGAGERCHTLPLSGRAAGPAACEGLQEDSMRAAAGDHSRVLRALAGYQGLVDRLTGRGAKPEQVPEPVGFHRSNPAHDQVFKLYGEALQARQDTIRRYASAEKRLQAARRAGRRMVWHQLNCLRPAQAGRRLFRARLARIAAAHDAEIEAVGQWGGKRAAERYELRKKSVLGAEWRARRTALDRRNLALASVAAAIAAAEPTDPGPASRDEGTIARGDQLARKALRQTSRRLVAPQYRQEEAV